MGKIFKILAGIGLCIVGVIGLILPIMPGWIFLIPGLVILAEYFPPIKRLLHWAKGKFEQESARMRNKDDQAPR